MLGFEVRESPLQECTGSGEAGFEGSFRHAEGARRGAHVHFMKIKQNDRLAIAKRQSQYGAPEHFVPFSFPEYEELGCGVRRLGRGFKRYGDSGKAFELGAEKVGGESEEPGGEAGFATPLRESAPGA